MELQNKNNMKFKSQICTTMKQSEHLLALGLKRETADMVHYISASKKEWGILATPWRDYYECWKYYSPTWSLHRLLLLLLDNRCVAYDHISFSIDETDVFTKVINHIEWLIKEGYFNKEYLV